jgi:hypothetical protein
MEVKQLQEFLKEQKQEQAQDLATAHDTMFLLLKNAELLAIGYDKKRELIKYERFYGKKSEDEIVDAIQKQIVAFKNTLLFYGFQYKEEFKYPKKWPLQKIQSRLKLWQSKANVKYKNIYEVINDIFINKITTFEEIPYSTKKDSPPSGVQVMNQANAILSITCDQKKIREQAAEMYKKNSEFDGLNPDDPNYPQYHQMNGDMSKKYSDRIYPMEESEFN